MKKICPPSAVVTVPTRSPSSTACHIRRRVNQVVKRAQAGGMRTARHNAGRNERRKQFPLAARAHNTPQSRPLNFPKFKTCKYWGKERSTEGPGTGRESCSWRN